MSFRDTFKKWSLIFYHACVISGESLRWMGLKNLWKVALQMWIHTATVAGHAFCNYVAFTHCHSGGQWNSETVLLFWLVFGRSIIPWGIKTLQTECRHKQATSIHSSQRRKRFVVDWEEDPKQYLRTRASITYFSVFAFPGHGCLWIKRWLRSYSYNWSKFSQTSDFHNLSLNVHCIITFNLNFRFQKLDAKIPHFWH